MGAFVSLLASRRVFSSSVSQAVQDGQGESLGLATSDPTSKLEELEEFLEPETALRDQVASST